MRRTMFWLQVLYTVVTALLAMLTYHVFALFWQDDLSAAVGSIVLWLRIWQLDPQRVA